ncbi:error-prone DNA polymerase [Bremerella sp. JC817]|uniref:error-prone DNA polymerase n=1 Tax=Bremerella sp. JC817 TaxID=3231756 RepID=UPI0034578F1A
MPDTPVYDKREPEQALASDAWAASIFPYAEVRCKTNFSFLEGASHADELVNQAASLGYRAIAVADRNTLAGVVRAHAAAKLAGIKLLVGAEVTLEDAPTVVLLATDRAAYGRLARLITLGRRQAPKGECRLSLADLAEHHHGLLALVVPDWQGNLCAARDLAPFSEMFGERCSLLAELYLGTDDQQRLTQLQELSRKAQIPLVASGNVLYHVPDRMVLQHVLTATRVGATVAQLEDELLPNAQRHLRPLEEVQSLFAMVPEAIRRTMWVADQCQFSLDELRYEYPRELAPQGETPVQYLRRLAWEGARHHYGQQVPQKICDALKHELDLIESLHYEAFFLTVYDLVRFARTRGILYQGRGSAANSAVCFCLGVTAVDPLSTQLLFERFISRERNEAPDIDVDFEHERREEVIQYVYEKYGRERAGMTAVVVTYRPRSAVRDVGKALGLSLDRIDTLAKNIDHRLDEELLSLRFEQVGIDPKSRLGRQLLLLVRDLIGFPRHLSQHVGGLVITQGALCELVPIENGAMTDRTVIQWDKDDLDELGILKVDCLSLGMLTAIRRAFTFLNEQYGEQKKLTDFREANDPVVYQMISDADTMGVFQIESRAQMSMLPRLRPNCFYDLVIEVAIVRPGPIQGDMVHPYLRRRDMDRDQLEQELADTCPTPQLRSVLERTLGVPLFQEQAMQLAVAAAGFTPGEADQLRRAMGGWRRPGIIDTFRRKLMVGMRENGHSAEFAERLFNQIRGFGEYGFPESHAASFANLVYVSAWLKCYHHAIFTAALINSQPMGFYAPAQLIRDARDHGVEVRPVDVNLSNWDCTLERVPAEAAGKFSLALRLGLRMVRGLKELAARQVLAQRSSPYRSIEDVSLRTGIDRGAIEALARADAFGSMRLDRRKALWDALDAPQDTTQKPLLGLGWGEREEASSLPSLSDREEVYADYLSTGLTLRQHPISFYRERLDQLGVLRSEQLATHPHDKLVKVAGLILIRQRPSTAKGITFVTIEDETGTANLVVHTHIWQRFDQVARHATSFIAQGKLERVNKVIHVVVRRLEDLATTMGNLHHRSRDFR